LKSYCTGLLLPGERKSHEPMAARLAPGNVRRMHQSLHHLVADSPWSDEALLGRVWELVLPATEKQGPVVAWIVDDTGFPKKGAHSVGVTRQYCGQLGKQENCQVAVSLSVATWNASLPIAYQLYLPESWANDRKRRRRAGVPDGVGFRTKPQIALEQIRQAVEADVRRGVVLGDGAYGSDGQFRAGLTELGLEYVVGVQSSMTVWAPGRNLWAPSRGAARGVRPNCCAGTAHISQFLSNSWPWGSLPRPGKPSRGAPGNSGPSAPALPPCESGPPIGTTGERSLTRRSGC
jgi:SRSO17 transposase